MAEEGVVGSTVSSLKAHPALIIGAVVGVVALLWIVSKRKAAPENFTFSYGPSDQQVKAGTELAIAQAADQTQVSLAQMASTDNRATATSYFDYLTHNSANQLQATTIGGQDAISLAQIKSNTAQYIANVNAGTAQHGQDTAAYTSTYNTAQGFASATQIAGINAGVAEHAADLASYTSTYNKTVDGNVAINASGNAANVAIYQAGAASYTSTFNKAQDTYGSTFNKLQDTQATINGQNVSYNIAALGR